MGLCQSEEDNELTKKNKAINKELQQMYFENIKIIKLLLLGTGECGKSTILKQMKILHDHGFTEEEKSLQKCIVYNNVIESMVTILVGMRMLQIKFEDPTLEKASQIVMEAAKGRKFDQCERLYPELCSALNNLWQDKAVSVKAIERGNEYQLPECASYFLNSVDRISQPDYKPSEQDILLSRKQTTGIVEVKFRIKDKDFRVFDVGGQRSERKKWIHCFEGVHAIIFLAAISEFDQLLLEDATTNRLMESTRLFAAICNSCWFIQTSMILFLNKKDLFLEKINKRKSIKLCFEEYEGPSTYDDSIAYIERKFISLNANPHKEIYTHHTCATDTNQVNLIMDSVVDNIVKKNLMRMGY